MRHRANRPLDPAPHLPFTLKKRYKFSPPDSSHALSKFALPLFVEAHTFSRMDLRTSPFVKDLMTKKRPRSGLHRVSGQKKAMMAKGRSNGHGCLGPPPRTPSFPRCTSHCSLLPQPPPVAPYHWLGGGRGGGRGGCALEWGLRAQKQVSRVVAQAVTGVRKAVLGYHPETVGGPVRADRSRSGRNELSCQPLPPLQALPGGRWVADKLFSLVR